MTSGSEIVILGYHRSGTSAFSRYLHKMGLYLGDELLGPKFSNPHGHYEDAEIVKINQDMLTINKVSWLADEFQPIIPSENCYAKAQSIALIRSANHQIWGFKDPRTCLVLNIWKNILINPIYVFVLRDPLACIDSVIRRAKHDLNYLSKFSKGYEFTNSIINNHDKVAMSYINYTAELIRFLRINSNPVLFYHMDQIDSKVNPARDINILTKKAYLEESPIIDSFDHNIFTKKSDYQNVGISKFLNETCYDYYNELINTYLNIQDSISFKKNIFHLPKQDYDFGKKDGLNNNNKKNLIYNNSKNRSKIFVLFAGIYLKLERHLKIPKYVRYLILKIVG